MLDVYVSLVFPHCIRGFVHIYSHLYLYIFGHSASIMNTSALHNNIYNNKNSMAF
jgi:hypothetical protein